MRITFDPPKNARNILERGLAFERVTELEWGTALAVEDKRRDYGEIRLRVFGLLDQRLHAAVITIRGDGRQTGKRSGGMDKEQTDRATRPDDENPEWTREDFRAARPALEMVGEAFGRGAADALRRRRGRPAKPDRKINQTLRLDPDVIEAYRRQGSGWQTRINEVLRTHMPGSGSTPADASGAKVDRPKSAR